jgi:hypothetical protein
MPVRAQARQATRFKSPPATAARPQANTSLFDETFERDNREGPSVGREWCLGWAQRTMLITAQPFYFNV